MDEQLALWQTISVILGVSAVIVAPSIWYTRKQAEKNEKETEKLESDVQKLVDAMKESTEKTVEAMINRHEQSSKETRADLKEFREHFDKRIGEIYSSIDTKNKELREFITNEILFIKNLINELERKIDVTREKNHELEKELMRIQNDTQKNFVTKEHFNAIIKLSGNFEGAE